MAIFRRLKSPSTLGLKRLGHDLIHRRYRFRQLVGILFIFVLAFVGEPRPDWFVAGLVFILPGLAIRLWAAGHVRKDKQLATTGPYAFVRHPLYVGNHLLALGFCLASGLWWSFLAWGMIALLFYPGTHAHEDKVLHRLFGADWEAWEAEVRALIPRLTPYRPGVRGEWSLSQCWHNGELVIVAILIALLALLYLRLV
jgi:protein-S-isoprenylcysteine O-methyltransferase Ste14